VPWGEALFVFFGSQKNKKGSTKPNPKFRVLKLKKGIFQIPLSLAQKRGKSPKRHREIFFQPRQT
jgi:hypothetical protein